MTTPPDPLPASAASSTLDRTSGPLLSDDGSWVLGAAVLLEAPDARTARSVLSAVEGRLHANR